MDLWISNDQGLYVYAMEAAQESLEGTGGDVSLAVAELADSLDSFMQEIAEGPLSEGGFIADLLSAAFSEIDWRSIASYYINETKIMMDADR